jgi:hypothetical protein
MYAATSVTTTGNCHSGMIHLLSINSSNENRVLKRTTVSVAVETSRQLSTAWLRSYVVQ